MANKKQISGHIDQRLPAGVQVLQSRINSTRVENGEKRITMDEIYEEALIMYLDSKSINWRQIKTK